MNKIPDKLKLNIASESKLLNVSDIHLAARQTNASKIVEDQLVERVNDLSENKTAVIVLNGDIFELWAGVDPGVAKALKAHHKLSRALEDFSRGKNHHVVFVIGNHDGSLAWDESAQKLLVEKFSASICLTLEVVIKTKKGSRSIVFEHGHMLDHENASEDPRDPNSKSLGQYIVQEIMPMIMSTQGDILKGLNHLQERDKYGKFAISKLFYKDLLARIIKLIFAIVLISSIEIFFATYVNDIYGYNKEIFNNFILYSSLIVLSNFVILILLIILLFKGLAKRAGALPKTNSSDNLNKLSETKAKDITRDKNIIGFVTGHTHQAQLFKFANGFYANSGCGVEQVEEAEARFKMPKPFISKNNLNILEMISTDNEITVRLFEKSTDNGGLNIAEIIFAKKPKLNIENHKVKEIIVKY